MLSGLRAMFMDLAMNVVAPGTWSRGMVLGPPECTLEDCHPGSKGFNRPSCLVSFQCSLVVIWALPSMSKLWRFSLLSVIGGSIIIGASSLAGMVETPLPKSCLGITFP